MSPRGVSGVVGAVVFVLLSLVTTVPARGQSVDAGIAKDAGIVVDGGTSAAQPTADASESSAQAGPTSLSWAEERLQTLRQKTETIKRAVKDLKGLKDSQVVLAGDFAKHFSFSLADPDLAEKELAALARETERYQSMVSEKKVRQGLLRVQLLLPSQRLAVLKKSRRGRRKITPDLEQKVAANRDLLALIDSETELLEAELTLRKEKHLYLSRSQPARLAAHLKRTKEQEEDATRAKLAAEQARQKAKAEQEAAETARQKAKAEQEAAEKAQREALEVKNKALSETARLLATERARLEGIRGQQAQARSALVGSDDARQALRNEMEGFRGGIVTREESLRRGWPETAPAHDKLYDEVVAKWALLQVEASQRVLAALRGPLAVVGPGKGLSPTVLGLDAAYADQVKSLEELHSQLVTAAKDLETSQQTARDDYLVLVHREVSWLNARRLSLFQRISPRKRSSLTGISTETLRQLLREVDNLIFDALYWVNQRRHQVDEVPGLIRDLFTVGSLLWVLIKILFLLALLRYLLGRWNRWLEFGFERAQRSVSLGENAIRLAKLLDTLRHSGPALLVLFATMLIYQLLGGAHSVAELQVCYVVIFWISLYRFMLRVVESKAEQAGLRKALQSATDAMEIEEEEEKSGVEEEDAPKKRTRKLSAWVSNAKVIPGPVLAVRSFQATSRYILAVVLALDLTRLAVGKGTFYQLTKEFSWWAAVPFLIYFLRLWRPHIIAAYQHLQKDASAHSLLTRLVRRSENSWYAVFVVAAAFVVVLANRIVSFARNSLLNRDATKKMLAFLFRRSVAKHAEELGRVVAKRQDLPQEILDQFSFEALTRRELPTDQPLMDEIKEAFKTWQADQTDGSLALVGRSGMGKSTALELLTEALDTEVLRGNVKVKITSSSVVLSWLGDLVSPGSKVATEKDLVRLIVENGTSVIALDNCHNFFLRQVDGFEGWSTFIRVVNETCDRVFWMLTFDQSAWDYLNNVAQRVHYFRRLIVMPSWTEEQIRSLIMQRMRRARYGVSFSDLVVSQLQGAALSAQLGRTSAGYFRLLWDLTGGNPRLAGHFWLDSLVPAKGSRAMHVHLFQAPEIEQLEALPDDILFVLTAVAEHQNLTVKEAASVTNLAVDFCRFAFKLCQEEGYLERGANQLRYRLGRRWQVSILRFLKRRHLLHG